MFSLGASSKTLLKKKLKPKSSDEISSIFEDMVVVQRKAKEKRKHLLLAPFMSFDFSDGPQTMYAGHLSIGYAFNDFWEAYVDYVPAFITQDRSLVKILEEKNFSVTVAHPSAQYGFSILWAPAYGKDSWGPYSLVRSDTFFKWSSSIIQYENATGMNHSLSLGKTYFLSDWFNLRLAAGGSLVDTILDGTKSSRFVAIFELGLVYYISL